MHRKPRATERNGLSRPAMSMRKTRKRILAIAWCEIASLIAAFFCLLAYAGLGDSGFLASGEPNLGTFRNYIALLTAGAVFASVFAVLGIANGVLILVFPNPGNDVGLRGAKRLWGVLAIFPLRFAAAFVFAEKCKRFANAPMDRPRPETGRAERTA